jgi:hypothetical protein
MAIMLLAGGTVAVADKEEIVAQLQDDLNYSIETNVWYKVVRENSVFDDENSIRDGFPSYYNQPHGVRIYKGCYLEAPVNLYMLITKNNDVVWKVEYARLQDVRFRNGGRSASKISHTETFYYTLGTEEPYRVKYEELPDEKGFMFYVVMEVSEQQAKEMGKDVKAGSYAIVIYKFKTGYASKKQGTISFIEARDVNTFKLIKTSN